MSFQLCTLYDPHKFNNAILVSHFIRLRCNSVGHNYRHSHALFALKNGHFFGGYLEQVHNLMTQLTVGDNNYMHIYTCSRSKCKLFRLHSEAQKESNQ